MRTYEFLFEKPEEVAGITKTQIRYPRRNGLPHVVRFLSVSDKDAYKLAKKVMQRHVLRRVEEQWFEEKLINVLFTYGPHAVALKCGKRFLDNRPLLRWLPKPKLSEAAE